MALALKADHFRERGIWALWRNIAKQDPSFGRPDKFCTYPDQSYWMSATLRKSEKCENQADRL